MEWAGVAVVGLEADVDHLVAADHRGGQGEAALAVGGEDPDREDRTGVGVEQPHLVVLAGTRGLGGRRRARSSAGRRRRRPCWPGRWRPRRPPRPGGRCGRPGRGATARRPTAPPPRLRPGRGRRPGRSGARAAGPAGAPLGPPGRVGRPAPPGCSKRRGRPGPGAVFGGLGWEPCGGQPREGPGDRRGRWPAGPGGRWRGGRRRWRRARPARAGTRRSRPGGR